MCCDWKIFGGLSILVLHEFLQLQTINRKPIYGNIEDNHNLEKFSGLKMWHMFQYIELREIMR